MSIGLLSLDFVRDAGFDFLVAPLVAFSVKDGRLLPKTAYTDRMLTTIVRYFDNQFKSDTDMKQYVIESLPQNGTHLLIKHLWNPIDPKAKNELRQTETGDILLTADAQTWLDINSDSFEASLVSTAKLLLIQWPRKMTLKIGVVEHRL